MNSVGLKGLSQLCCSDIKQQRLNQCATTQEEVLLFAGGDKLCKNREEGKNVEPSYKNGQIPNYSKTERAAE